MNDVFQLLAMNWRWINSIQSKEDILSAHSLAIHCFKLWNLSEITFANWKNIYLLLGPNSILVTFIGLCCCLRLLFWDGLLFFLLVFFAHLRLYFAEWLSNLFFLPITANISWIEDTSFGWVLNYLVLELISSNHLSQGLKLRIFEHLKFFNIYLLSKLCQIWWTVLLINYKTINWNDSIFLKEEIVFPKFC